MSFKSKLILKIEQNSNEYLKYLPLDFILSTLWFSKGISEVLDKNRPLLIKRVISLLTSKGIKSLSILEIKRKNTLDELKVLFKSEGVELTTFIPSEDGADELSKLDDDFIFRILDPREDIHNQLCLNVFIFKVVFSGRNISFEGKMREKLKEMLSTYDGTPEKALDYVGTARATLLAMSHDKKINCYYNDEIEMEKIQPHEEEKNILTKDEIDSINFKNINFITGNGLSKYVTHKETKDTWLIDELNWDVMKEIMLDLTTLLKEELINEIENKDLEELPEYLGLTRKDFSKEELKEIKAFMLNDKETYFERVTKYIESNEYLYDLQKFKKDFKKLLIKFDEHISNYMQTTNNKQFSINDKENNRLIDEIAKENNIKDFDTKDRPFLSMILMFIQEQDIESNPEVILTIIDKFTKNPVMNAGVDDQITEDEYLSNYVLKYIFPDAYIEYIWNEGKVNSLPDKTNKIKNKSVFTLNYDNITGKLFEGRVHHLHGAFDKVVNYKRKANKLDVELGDVEEIVLDNKNYHKQTIPKLKSIILKGGDYKFDFIKKVNNNTVISNSLKKLSKTKGDFMIIGSLIVGDPHLMLSIISNCSSNLYLTYYDEKELDKLGLLRVLAKQINPKIEVKFINFIHLMEKMGI